VDLEQRVGRIEDRLELGELPGRYSRALDDRDMPALLELFCADAAVDAPDGTRVATGHAELEHYYGGAIAAYGMSIHVPHVQVIEHIDDDEAGGWVLGHAEMTIGDEFGLAAMRYHDRYRREGGRWRFAHRTNVFWYFTEWSRLGELARTAHRCSFRGDSRAADLPAWGVSR
jgi:ketosteroid isomerase-like protein